MAVIRGNIAILEYLNNKGVEMDNNYDNYKNTPVHLVEYCNLESIRFLRCMSVKLNRFREKIKEDNIILQSPLDIANEKIQYYDDIEVQKNGSYDEYKEIVKYLKKSKNMRNR